MKIRIAHLFYDLLNLYGESGNILALQSALKKQNIDTEIVNISLGDKLDLEDIDFIYIGAGTEENQKIALDYLKKSFEELNQAILNNKFFLVTGNSIELFGKAIKSNLDKIETLNIFDFETIRTEKRLVAECVFRFEDFEILGFENHQGKINGIVSPLFTVIKGYSANDDTKCEGIIDGNFYGTYLIGPLLVRNPKFLVYICKKIILSKEKNFEFKPFNLELEEKAFDTYIKKYNDI